MSGNTPLAALALCLLVLLSTPAHAVETDKPSGVDLSPAGPTAGAQPLYFSPLLTERFSGSDSLFFEGKVGQRRFLRTQGHYQIDARESVIPATSVVPVGLGIYRATARFKPVVTEENDSAEPGPRPLYGLVLNYREDSPDGFSYYLFAVDGKGSAYLLEVSDGDAEELASSTYPSGGEWTELSAEVVRGTMVLEVGGEQVIEHYDNSLPSGGVGFYTRGENAVNADDFRLERPVFRAADIDESFADRNKVRQNWFLGRAAQSVFRLRDGEYRIDAREAGEPAVAMIEGAARDFTATVRLRYREGDPSKGFGLFFRARPDDRGRMSYKRVLVNDLKGVTLQQHTPGEDANLWGWELSDAYRPEEANRLRVSVTGSNVRVSLNGEPVFTHVLQDDPRYGRLGLLAAPGTSIAVKSFRLRVRDAEESG